MRMDVVAVVLAFIFSISIMLASYYASYYAFYNPTISKWIELEREIEDESGEYCIISFSRDLRSRGVCNCTIYTYRILENNTLIKICRG